MKKRNTTTYILAITALTLMLVISLLIRYQKQKESAVISNPPTSENEKPKENIKEEENTEEEEKEEEPESEEPEPEPQPEPEPEPEPQPEPEPEPVYEEPVYQQPVYTPPSLSAEFTDPYSLLVVANKKYALDYWFEPSDLRVVNTAGNRTHYLRDCAASALETMYAAAANEGVTLITCSSYRSASYQDTLYNNYVAMYGTAVADTISARPGYSDHQTGLAVDIGDHDQATVFTQAMENTVEGQWLYAHAHEYGFILRYPKGKEWITGYSFEPWHYRYVGVDYATAIYSVSPDCTMEEYFGIEGGDYAS